MGRQTNVDLFSSFIILDASGAKKKDVSSSTFAVTSFIRDELIGFIHLFLNRAGKFFAGLRKRYHAADSYNAIVIRIR